MKSSLRKLQPFGGCMDVSVVEERRAATSTASTSSVHSGSSSSSSPRSAREDEPTRKRTSSVEAWLHKVLHIDPEQRKDKDADKQARRAKRKAFFRKLFGGDTRATEFAADPSSPVQMHEPPPAKSKGSFSLGDVYYASMSGIVGQYDMDDDDDVDGESDTVSTNSSPTDVSEVSVFELDDDVGAIPMVPLAHLDALALDVDQQHAGTYVAPPVSIPMEYTIKDRRGGTLVAGHHVLFTSAAFKRKQRQLLYQMRAIPETAPFVAADMGVDDDDDDDDDGESCTTGAADDLLESEWI